MTHLKNDITAELQDISTQWPSLRQETSTKISAMGNYYSDIRNKNEAEVVRQTKRNRDELRTDQERHERFHARAENAVNDLTRQKESSEGGVQRMTKYGPKAVLGFAVMMAVIGAVIGAKVPGWGQVVAIVAGGVIGFFLFGGLALLLYFFLKWRAIERRDMWRVVQNENRKGIALAPIIKTDRSNLSEIRNQLNDIENDNMANGLPFLVDKMARY